MSDMSSSSSSFVSGEAEGVQGRHLGFPCCLPFRRSLWPRGPGGGGLWAEPGSWVFPLPPAKALPAPPILGGGHTSYRLAPSVLPSEEPPFLLCWLSHPLQITDGSKFKAEIIVEQLAMLELALGDIYLMPA